MLCCCVIVDKISLSSSSYSSLYLLSLLFVLRVCQVFILVFDLIFLLLVFFFFFFFFFSLEICQQIKQSFSFLNSHSSTA